MPDQVGRGREGGNGGEGVSDIPLAEWLVAALGMALVGAAVVFMLYRAVWGDHSPPEITVAVENVGPAAGGFMVGFRAVNTGGSAAEGVVVRGELKGDVGAPEESHTVLDHLPSHSERRGGLFFSNDPRRYELRVRALGYQEP